MDKNYKQKVKDFFRKEGFYIVLVVCLCIVATVATIAFKRINENKKTANVSENDKEISMNVQNEDTQKEADKNVSTNEIQNAERAENTQKPETATKQEKQESKQVSTNNEMKFSNPVDGVLLRGFTDNKPVQISEDEFRTIKGIDIEAKVGTDVKAAAEGIVESVGQGDTQEGITVVIKHANGMKTKYCNLDKETLVKKDEQVTAGTVIGKVGSTVKIFGDDYFEEYLNIQVFNANNEQVDPLKYFSYKSKQ